MYTTDNGAAQRFRLERDAWGQAVLINSQGRRFVGVEAVRAFPMTDPRHGISICDADGQEIVWIDNLDDLAAPLRHAVEDELSRRHFLPRIQRVVDIAGLAEPTSWQVDTDRGVAKFTLKSEEDVRRLGAGRVVIIDNQGLRYLIEDVQALDSKSRRLLARYI